MIWDLAAEEASYPLRGAERQRAQAELAEIQAQGEYRVVGFNLRPRNAVSFADDEW